MRCSLLRWTADRGWSEPLPAVDGPSTMVLVFGDREAAQDPQGLDELHRAYRASVVVGCSTAGQIHRDVVVDGGLTVLVIAFDDATLTLAGEPVPDPATSFCVGRDLAARLVAADPDVQAIFVLAEGLGVNGSQLVAGMTEGAGRDLVITGGLAGDGPHFEQTWVLVEGRPSSRYVTAVGLSGPALEVGYGSRGGWDMFGPERRITKAVGNVLYELDGKPALELYKRYLGDRADGLPATALLFPLSVRVGPDDDRRVVRTILAVDEATQSMTFAGDVPEGGLAQLMRANLDRLLEGAEVAARAAGAEDGRSQPCAAVAISCVGRRLVLGERTEEELESALGALPEGSQVSGFYSYGEISPITTGTCDLHNQTMTVTTFREREAA